MITETFDEMLNRLANTPRKPIPAPTAKELIEIEFRKRSSLQPPTREQWQQTLRDSGY